MARWVRYEQRGRPGFGTLRGQTIRAFKGDMFRNPVGTDDYLQLSEVRVGTPCKASKMVCLWNNFNELATKLGIQPPDEPLYVLKAPSAFLAHGQTIRRPAFYTGKVVYEGELGIVMGAQCSCVEEAEADEYILGYTCVNDVTAADIIHRNPNFPQWARAKSYDTFGVFGPVIETDVDPMTLRIRTVLNGQERQNYATSDMIFSPARLVSLISQDMTLLAGDIIACGTSVGVGTIKESKSTIEVAIEGIGTLSNVFE